MVTFTIAGSMLNTESGGVCIQAWSFIIWLDYDWIMTGLWLDYDWTLDVRTWKTLPHVNCSNHATSLSWNCHLNLWSGMPPHSLEIATSLSTNCHLIVWSGMPPHFLEIATSLSTNCTLIVWSGMPPHCLEIATSMSEVACHLICLKKQPHSLKWHATSLSKKYLVISDFFGVVSALRHHHKWHVTHCTRGPSIGYPLFYSDDIVCPSHGQQVNDCKCAT